MKTKVKKNRGHREQGFEKLCWEHSGYFLGNLGSENWVK